MKKRGIVLSVLVLVMLALCGCGKKASGEYVTVFNYGMYIDPDILDQFQEETGIEVKYEEALTPEELYTKYKSGAINYDVLCTSDYMLKRLIDEGEAQKIDYSSMEHIGNIDDKYWEFSKAFDEELEYTIPYFWGTVGILYDTTKVHGPIDSWEVLFNGEYKNDIIMQKSQRDAYMLTLKYLGYSLNTTNEAEIREAQELLLKQKPDVQAYLVDEARDEVVAGNAAMAVIYSGEAYLGHEYNSDLAYVVPKEGSNVWLDAWMMTKDCHSTENALKFLDFLCREDIAMKNFEYVYYYSPNEAVLENMTDEQKANPILMPDDAVTDRCEVCVQNDPATLELYNTLWKELMAE